MSIIGFNFTKIDVAKSAQQVKKQVSVSNNVGISMVEEAVINLGTSSAKPLKFSFFFHCNFDPDLGHIHLDGEIVALFEGTQAQEILDAWTANRKVPPEHATKVLNAALSRAQIMALSLSKDVSLPLPVQLPKIVSKDMSEPAKETAKTK